MHIFASQGFLIRTASQNPWLAKMVNALNTQVCMFNGIGLGGGGDRDRTIMIVILVYTGVFFFVIGGGGYPIMPPSSSPPRYYITLSLLECIFFTPI